MVGPPNGSRPCSTINIFSQLEFNKVHSIHTNVLFNNIYLLNDAGFYASEHNTIQKRSQLL